MQRVAEGDVASFQVLLGRWEGPAKRYAYRMFGDYQLAEDLAQEAFVRLYKSAGRYTPTARFSTYFYTVLGNLCRDRVRSERRRKARGETFDHGAELDQLAELGEAERPDQAAELEEERLMVRAAVAQLPDKLMEALSLREFEGLSYRDIADVMGANLGEVKTWIHRGRKKLAARLERLLAQEGRP